METCFKILQFKFDQKLTNRCIGLTLKISSSTRNRRPLTTASYKAIFVAFMRKRITKKCFKTFS